jgi:hypothetical protein
VTVTQNVDEISEEEAGRIAPHLFSALGEHAVACSAPFVLEKSAAYGSGVESGSCTLIKTPSRSFGVTNAHVIRPAIELLESGQGRVLIGQSQFANFLDCIIDISDDLDLATFLIPEDALPYIRAKVGMHCRFSEYWPPSPPIDGGGVFMAGWPGEMRSDDEARFTFRPFAAMFVVQSVTEHSINIVRDREREMLSGNPDYLYDFQLGGVSGGPMFCMTKINGLIQPTICGVFVEEQHAYGILKGARIDCIDENGNILSQ